jgi:phosphoglycolate phosphatase
MCALLVLWDIDHTLIENNGVNKEIYALVFELLAGRRPEHLARTEGRTEPEIIRGMLARHGIEVTPEHVDRMPRALEGATRAYANQLRKRGCELPGARDALTALQATPGIIQSVLTGNIRPNAITKLAAFGLDAFIDFEAGAYGSDDEDRPRLVAVAQKRAAARHGTTFTAANTVLIGDTPRDVRAGTEGGARVVAVATGSDSLDALRAEGADTVLPDLRNTGAVMNAVIQAAAA